MKKKVSQVSFGLLLSLQSVHVIYHLPFQNSMSDIMWSQNICKKSMDLRLMYYKNCRKEVDYRGKLIILSHSISSQIF